MRDYKMDAAEVDCIAHEMNSVIEENKKLKKKIKQLRAAVANYISSEGCDCCQGSNHRDHKAVLAKLLKVPMYPDKSGYEFYKFRTEGN